VLPDQFRAARLLSLATDGFETVDAWEVAREADRVACPNRRRDSVKLTDIQLRLLAAASQRDDRALSGRPI
jgi:hypothetical protein